MSDKSCPFLYMWVDMDHLTFSIYILYLQKRDFFPHKISPDSWLDHYKLSDNIIVNLFSLYYKEAYNEVSCSLLQLWT